MNNRQERIKTFSNFGFGLVLHWGLYSLLERGEWVQHNHKYDTAAYKNLINDFTASEFNAAQIAALARKSGAGFIILTTRHHDGFSLYDTRGLNEWDAPHSAARRDLVAEFVEACRNEGIMPIFYHTTLDWHWRGKTTWDLDEAEFKDYLDYLLSSVEILCTQYGPIGGLVFDGNWSRPDMNWNYDRLYGMIRKHQPHALIMDNTGLERPGVLEHPEIDVVTFEQHAVTASDKPYGEDIAAMRWLTLNDHWGVAPHDFNYKSGREILEGLTRSRRYGAVYTLNLGPLPNGGIDELDRAVLARIGRWMDLYGEAVKEGRVEMYQCETVQENRAVPNSDFVRSAGNGGKGYLFCHNLGIRGQENVTWGQQGSSLRRISSCPKKIRSIYWMDTKEELEFKQEGTSLTVNCSGFSYGENHVVRVAVLVWD
ncbi:MAG: alpha-L-fucosidase [Acidobacteria bacterium]|nr:MAG: alpha-L-fucosidase [Acidobacteriota bacterium]